MPVRPGETSRDQTVSDHRGKETLVICACLQRISLLLYAEDQQSKNSPQERARGRIQIHRRFTLRSGSIGASSPLPRTTRHSHRLHIRNDTKALFIWSRVPETTLPPSYPGRANFSLISLKNSTDCLHENANSSREGETTRVGELSRLGR